MASDEEDMLCTPPEIREKAKTAASGLLPEKSRERYELVYQKFMDWRLKNNKPFNFRGLMAAVFTPFNNDPGHTLNLPIIPDYAKHLVDSDVTGVLVSGTTGEGPSLSVDERNQLTKIWAEVCAQTRQHLMVQVGGAPMPDVLELAKYAEQAEVSSLLCLPELYYKPIMIADIIRYLQTVSKAAPNTPLLYYHGPSMTNVNINMGSFLNKVGDKIPTFCGIKFTSTALDEGLSAMKANNEKFTVFLAPESVMAGAFALGFDSTISSVMNVFPEHGHQILQAIEDGDVVQAQNKQNELNSAMNIILKYGNRVAAMKEAMNLLTHIDVGPVRQPLAPLLPEQIKEMEIELKSLKFVNI